ncbi:MAG: protein kinase [Chloroflexi bacterium]|nr:protein kinase [Chloroflexota bacterium]
MFADLLPDGTILQGQHDQYRILGIIGRGGMGAVYRGERLSDGSTWAVKEMRPPAEAAPEEIAENRKLFDQEAQLLQTLDHPNLPKVVDSFEQAGRPTLVMEFVQGKTLEDKQREMNAPFFQRDVLNWGVQIARVLNYLHSQNPPIIFRDMKPPNVMLTPEGIIKLIDFGVARTYKTNKSKDTVAMGSAGYAPPEQYGKGQTDARADIYALGATLLHMLTNLPPVPLQTPKDGSLIKHNQSVTPEMEQVIIRSMAMDREKRFQTMASFEQALLAVDRGVIVPDKRDDPTMMSMPAPVFNNPNPNPAPAWGNPNPNPAPAWGNPSPPQYQQPMPQPVPQPAPSWAPPVQTPAWSPPPQANGPICDQCGRMNKPNARFCAGCGAAIKRAVPKLVITSPRAVWELALTHFPCRIGRRDPAQNHHPEIDLAEHDRGVASRRHAVIEQQGDHHLLIDLGSINGTSINGVPMTAYQPHHLRPGDRIRIGDVEMVFSIE